MKDLPGMKILPVLLLTAVTLLIGCSAPTAEERARSQVRSLLNPDGMEYSITGGSAWEMIRKDIEGMLSRAAEDSKDLVSSRYFASLKYLFRLMVNISGAESVLCTGRSSELFAENIVHEKIVLVYDPENAGLFKSFFNAENTIDPRELFETIPEKTAAVLCADVDPLALLESLKDYGEFADMLVERIPAGFPVREILESCDGIWKLYIFDLNSRNPVFKLDIPDEKSTIFDIFALLTRRPKVETRLHIPGFGVVKKSEKRVIFYIGQDCEKLSAELPGKALLPQKPVLLTGLPEKAVLFGFMDAKRLPEEFNGFELGGVKIPSLVEDKFPAVAAIARLPEKNGYLAVENGSSSILSSDISLLLEVVVPFLKDLKIPTAKAEKSDSRVKAAENIPVAAKECRCAELLSGAAAALKTLPDAVDGFYLLKDGKLFPSEAGEYDVVFFKADSGSCRYLPLIIAKPHADGFCAIVGEKGTGSYQLPKPESFRRIIGFLHTVYKFDEKIFRKLIVAAGEFDRKKR